MSYIEGFVKLVIGEQVTVTVGTAESKTYDLPRALLCTEPWSDRALQRDAFVEGREGKIALPEDDPRSFEVYLCWLYCGCLDLEQNSPDTDATASLQAELEQCLGSWMFGDKFCSLEFQNAVMLRACHILATKKLVLSPNVVGAYYAGTAVGSPLRILAAESVVRQVRERKSTIEAYQAVTVHEGFLTDIAAAQDAFHEHRGDFPRYSKPLKYKPLFYVEDPDAALKGPASCYVGKWVARTVVDCVDCLAHNANVRCDDCKEGKQDQRPCVHNGTSRRRGGCEGVGDAPESQEE
ncbi:hypothetical protein LTR53_005725 [Teratosphaeriaceae sp. CCFEE 6253]|nr:hypothetical protein LTR53_005725 [Teratosphaeriaceae sp. CCFEE 6253]